MMDDIRSSKIDSSNNNDNNDIDEDLCLSDATAAALAEFLHEQRQQSGSAENHQHGETVNSVKEDWQLSQFWYNKETADFLARETVRAGRRGESGDDKKVRVAFISAPTAFMALEKLNLTETMVTQSLLLEFDRRFGESYGGSDKFLFYDYKTPLEGIPLELKHSFDAVLLDPPFLARECLEKTAQTAKFLAKENDPKFIICTGAVMEADVLRLFSARPTPFEPQHEKNLANNFTCYANYELTLDK